MERAAADEDDRAKRPSYERVDQDESDETMGNAHRAGSRSCLLRVAFSTLAMLGAAWLLVDGLLEPGYLPQPRGPRGCGR